MFFKSFGFMFFICFSLVMGVRCINHSVKERCLGGVVWQDICRQASDLVGVGADIFNGAASLADGFHHRRERSSFLRFIRPHVDPYGGPAPDRILGAVQIVVCCVPQINERVRGSVWRELSVVDVVLSEILP